MRAVFCFGIHDVFCPTRCAVKTCPAKMPNLSTPQFSFFKNTQPPKVSSPRSTCRGFTFCVFIFARMCPLQTGCAREQASTGWCCRSRLFVCCVMMLARSPRLMLRDKLCCWLELSRFDGKKLGRLFGLLEPASHDAPVGVPHVCLSLSVRQATTMVVRGLGCAALSACLCAQPSVWPQRRDVSRSPILPTPVSTSCVAVGWRVCV